MKKPWTIGILSTDYDLKYEREAVQEFLSENKVKVHAFERSDFNIEPFTNTYDACLIAIDRIDIAIVIINKRYGSLVKDLNLSITEAEYNAAYEKKKIIIPCVHEETWNESRNYKNKNFKFNYVEDVSVLNFVNK